MDLTAGNCSIAIPFLPTLSHLATVKIAVPLYTHLSARTLNAAFEDIQKGHSAASVGFGSNKWMAEYAKAKESILFIPAHLRTPVVRAVNGLQYSVEYWRRSHSKILNIRQERRFFHWKADGTMDVIATAQELIQNPKVDLRIKFHLACMYCFEENIKTLWADIVESGTILYIKTGDKCMSRLGLKWLREGCRVPFIQAVQEHLHPVESSFSPVPRFSSFFPLLAPRNREKFLFSLSYTTLDDIKFCLCTVTKEDNERLLKTHSLVFLVLHLYWPMQYLFLEAAEKMWNFITVRDFKIVISIMLAFDCGQKDYDYGELFEGFWSRSPNHLKEEAMRCEFLRNKIDSYRKKKWKRIAEIQEEQTRKRKEGDSLASGMNEES